MKKYHYTILIENEVEYVDEEYPVIIFNDVFLPPGAVFIDVCASHEFLPTITEELSLWFWKFTICVGRTRTEESTKVISYATELKKLIIANEIRIKEMICKLYEPNLAENIYVWWVDTLDIMIATANQLKESKWRGILDFKRYKEWREPKG